MTENVPLLDLHAQFRSLEREIREAIDRVLASQHFILGPEVDALEMELAAYVGSPHAIGVSSGSDALLMSLMALGIGAGDEVVTTPYSFFATAGAISRVGARPVFADIDLRSFNIDVAGLAKFLTPRTRAILPVHLFGQCAEMEPLLTLSKQRGIPIIEDAAQAIGAEYQGKRAGSMGDIGCFSFFPSKNLGCFGDGGLVTTHDGEMARKLRIFRSHGSNPKYIHKYIGGNFRLDAIQAAVVRAKFPHLDRWTSARQRNADRYDSLFHESGLDEFVARPWRRPDDRHIFNQYVILASRRDALKQHLAENGIQTEIYYPLPMHLQECFSSLGHKKGDFPMSEKAAAESLALPIYPELSEAQQQHVAESIRDFYLRK